MALHPEFHQWLTSRGLQPATITVLRKESILQESIHATVTHRLGSAVAQEQTRHNSGPIRAAAERARGSPQNRGRWI